MTLESEDGMMASIRSAVRQAREGGLFAVVGFACRYCAYNGQEPEVVNAELPANVRAIPVLCSGKVDSLYMLKAFEMGADGVFVAGCMEDECHNTKGSTHAGQRLRHIKTLLDELGVGGERLEMFNLSSAQCANLAEHVAALVDKIGELGPSPAQRG
jgi:coenzyme F420-reducing hydrogenase delta subunit